MSLSAYKFGDFDLDPARFELRRDGRALKVERIPLELLLFLIEKDGSIATRQEIMERLWGKDVFVDAEHGINTAVRKIRQALRDDPEHPTFVQTVMGKGYRFIAPLIQIPDNGKNPASAQVIAPGSRGDEPGSSDLRDTIPAIPQSRPLPQSEVTPAVLRGMYLRVIAAAVLVIALALVIAESFNRYKAVKVAPSPAQHVMVAVLPFQNLSGDPSEDYFSDGLTEEIITQLGLLNPDQLGVIARTTSMAYKKTEKSAKQIGDELKVDYILENSVRRYGDQMRITVQLIRAQDQVHIWAHNYDRPVSHSIALQEEVARAVAEQIRIKLSPGKSSPRHLDSQANEAYLRGLYFGNQFTVAGYKKAITYFQQAIDRDPNFAEAYAGLADSYYFLVVTDSISAQEGESKAREAAQRAVRLDDGLAESHHALGSVLLGFLEWHQAEMEFKRAIELNPSYSPEHRLYAAMLVSLKRFDEAWEQIQQAMRTDPLSLPNNAEVVRTLYYSRDYDRAIQEANRGLQLAPDYYRIHFWMARVYAQKKMYPEAIAESQKVAQALPDATVGLTELAYSLAVGGRRQEARKILDRLEERSRHEFVPAYSLAVIHLSLNEREFALDYLEKAYEERDWAFIVLAAEPRLDPLRGESRFRELLVKLKLPS